MEAEKKWPVYGWIGLVLILIFWPLNWFLEGLRTHILFFPLWLGYSLTIDAWVFKRKGTSLLTRNKRAYLGLFLISAPAWWLFELFNLRTLNWIYQGREFFNHIEYGILATLSFSTVMPAVFGAAEWVTTFSWFKKLNPKIKLNTNAKTRRIFFITGWLMLVLLILWPTYYYVFIWLSVYFIIDPLNAWLGNRSLFKYTDQGDWRPVIALWVGSLITSFFWEMWNFFSYPKWIYKVPFVDFLHVFEMPVLGYLGYLPFSLELFALYHFILKPLQKQQLESYIKILPES